jgi:hypothetical protein
MFRIGSLRAEAATTLPIFHSQLPIWEKANHVDSAQ